MRIETSPGDAGAVRGESPGGREVRPGMRFVFAMVGGLAAGCGSPGEPPSSPARSSEEVPPATTATFDAPASVIGAPAAEDPCPVWPPPGASAAGALAALPADAPRLKLPDGGWVTVRTCWWLDESADRAMNQDIIRIGPDGAQVTRISIGFQRVGGNAYIVDPTLALAGADPLEVLVSGSYEWADAGSARKLQRHVLLDAHALDAPVDPSCLEPMGAPSLRQANWFDEIEGGEVINFGSTGDETWGLKATAKRVDALCWRIDERWRSPAGLRAPVWGYVTCWDAALGSLRARCDAAPYPPPRTRERP